MKRILVFLLAIILCVPSPAGADGQKSTDQLVPYGLLYSKNDQYIPVFDGIGSAKKTDLLMSEQLCALDFSKLQSKNYWYHVIYIDDAGTEQAGYVKEINFQQLTASELAEQMSNPENAELISRLIALSNTSPLFLGEAPTAKTISNGSAEKSNPQATYVLNTNTHKFHRPGCSSIKQMKAKNKKSFTGTRQEVINMGYSPCKKCNP